jgi:hypothetical protein
MLALALQETVVVNVGASASSGGPIGRNSRIASNMECW